jgi:hypothetical protein
VGVGSTLHSYALEWVDHYAGRGANDVINDRTRREYRRLLTTYALAYVEPDERLGHIDEHRARGHRGVHRTSNGSTSRWRASAQEAERSEPSALRYTTRKMYTFAGTPCSGRKRLRGPD